MEYYYDIKLSNNYSMLIISYSFLVVFGLTKIFRYIVNFLYQDIYESELYQIKDYDSGYQS